LDNKQDKNENYNNSKKGEKYGRFKFEKSIIDPLEKLQTIT